MNPVQSVKITVQWLVNFSAAHWRKRIDPTKLFPARFSIVFYECNNQKVLACGKHQLNCSANAYDGLTMRKTDLYIVMIEKGPIERTDRLVDSLFRGK